MYWAREVSLRSPHLLRSPFSSFFFPSIQPVSQALFRLPNLSSPYNLPKENQQVAPSWLGGVTLLCFFFSLPELASARHSAHLLKHSPLEIFFLPQRLWFSRFGHRPGVLLGDLPPLSWVTRRYSFACLGSFSYWCPTRPLPAS